MTNLKYNKSKFIGFFFKFTMIFFLILNSIFFNFKLKLIRDKVSYFVIKIINYSLLDTIKKHKLLIYEKKY
jgi:hypothetical protein